MVKDGYHSGGASYALSQESLRRFHRGHQIPNNAACRWNGGMEDSQIAKCLHSEGVYIGNSTDEHGRELFHPLPFQDHFLGTVPEWLPSHAANAVRNVSFLWSSLSFFITILPLALQLLQRSNDLFSLHETC